VLDDAALVAFLACTDLTRAEVFFGGVLGLEHLETTEYAAVFRSGPTTLRVTLVEQVTVAPYTVLGWTVPDIRAGLLALAGRGVPAVVFGGLPQDGDGVWTTPDGSQVAWFHDPDGNLLSLTQLA
jgi:catechol 2,3-dioxygenase-like lactoylglutathione lyase family enzyme